MKEDWKCNTRLGFPHAGPGDATCTELGLVGSWAQVYVRLGDGMKFANIEP